jgi:hypothetical protein
MKFSFRHLFNVGVVVIMAAVVITALGYDKDTRLLPLIVSVPVLILSIILTIQEFRGVDAGKKKKKEHVAGPEVFKKELVISVWIVAMFASLFLFGFILTTFFFTFVWLKFGARFGWGPSLAVSAGSLAFLYGVLITLLNVELFEGFVTIALRKAILGY